MADGASALTSSIASVTDVQVACIPVVISATATAAQQVSAGTIATSELKAALGL